MCIKFFNCQKFNLNINTNIIDHWNFIYFYCRFLSPILYFLLLFQQTTFTVRSTLFCTLFLFSCICFPNCFCHFLNCLCLSLHRCKIYLLMSVIYQSKRQYHSSNFQMPFYIHSLPLPTLLSLGEHLHVGLVLLLSSLSFPSLLVLKFIQIIQITMYFILYKCVVLLTFEYS